MRTGINQTPTATLMAEWDVDFFVSGCYGIIEQEFFILTKGDKTMNKLEAYRNENNKYHRTDGPAVIDHYADGSVYSEIYYINGKMHREGGPAAVTYDKNGSVVTESYYTNNEKHRDDGPAEIDYYPDGSVKSENWFDHGEEYYPSQEQVDAYRNKSNADRHVDSGMGR